MNAVRVIVVLVLCGLCKEAGAQCPVTDFTVAASACSNQVIDVANSSAPGTYAWDFCAGDLELVPSGQAGWSLAGANGRPGIELAYDNKWIGFATGTFSNVLYRMEFDNGLHAAPTTMQNLGGLIGAVSPGQVRIIKEAGQWYGLLHNTGGDLVKLSFGAQLTNTPTATTLISGISNLNSGLAIGRDDVHGYVCVLSLASNQFVMVRLGLSLSIPNPVTDVITSAAVPNPNNLGDVDLINVCGNWYGLADNLGNGNIYRLDFGTSLFSVPSINQLLTIPVANPGRIRWVKEGEGYYFLVLGLDGTLTKGSFGSTVTSIPALTAEGNLGGTLPAGMYGLGLANENSAWTILGVNQANGQVFRINYADNCTATPKTSSLSNPTVSYAAAGSYKVSLQNTSGLVTGSHESTITVSALPASDINFTSLNQCAGSNVNFTSVNTSGNIVDYNWDFGDSQNSTAVNPAHVYAAAGTFEPRLVVTASNGCLNSVSHSLTVFNQPVADFTLPSASPVCTNQPYLFTNASTYDLPSNPTWEWRVNGVLIPSQPDLTTLFSSAVSQEIRLKAIIPGCENEKIQSISTVLPGPVITFSASDDCVSNVVPFTNGSTGVDAGFVWDFGDGAQSTAASPTHQYLTPGNYTVTLTGSNIAGCENVSSVPVRIYSLPQPDFDVGLPPFSCSDTPTPFQNNTPALTDSNLQDWLWNFGDTGSSLSTSFQPSFTYSAGGNYSVQLTATSDAGCSNTVTKLISIGTSPVADFVFGPSCVNQPTLFSDLSTGPVQSWVWQVASSTYSIANPSHTFSIPGSYPVTLTVTASGGCTSMMVQPVIVPVMPSLVLQTSNTCAGQPTNFNLVDSSSPVVDAVVGWQWNIAGTLATGNPVQHSIGIAGGAPVSVLTTHASGCSYLTSNTVNILASPVASFTASTDRGEAPLTVQFQNTSNGATQYLWNFSGNTPGSSTAVSPTYTFLDLGDHSAQLTAIHADGCSDTEIMPIHVLTAMIDLKLIDFSLSPDVLTGKMKANVTVRNNSNVPLGTVEVALHLSSEATVNENLTVNLDPGESAVRTLSFSFSPNQLADGYVCAELISEKDIQSDNNRKCISLDDGDFILPPYPNPSSGTLRLDWVSAAPGTARLIIYNSQGRREYEWETPSAAGLNQSQHDLSFLAAGVYLITLQTPDAQRTMRFVKQ